MSAGAPMPLVVNGGTIFAHPLFLDQLDALTREVETLKRKDPKGFVKKNATKRLAALAKLAFEIVPQDPARPEYRQGGTLGEDYKHWFRAKFFQQYRLFFRYHAQAKVIVYAWVNDADTKRATKAATTLTGCFARCCRKAVRPMAGIGCHPKLAPNQNGCGRPERTLAPAASVGADPQPFSPYTAGLSFGSLYILNCR